MLEFGRAVERFGNVKKCKQDINRFREFVEADTDADDVQDDVVDDGDSLIFGGWDNVQVSSSRQQMKQTNNFFFHFEF